MDPVSQAVVGAVAAQAAVKISNQKLKHYGKAALLGALAGMAADLDVLINSDTDSLLSLEYHRQFTHALLFIPIGGLICSLIFYGLLHKWWRLKFATLYLWSTAGYATHGLLDSCTSYGTQLFWPFSDYRVSWDIISIIDPLFTLPLLALVVLACRQPKKAWAVASVVWLAGYLALGSIQHHRAMNIAEGLVAQRNHQAIRIEVKPSFANLVVWKIVYETADKFFVDGVKLGIKQTQVFAGSGINKLDIDRDLPWLDKSSQQAKDIERFRWFSAGFVSLDPRNPLQVVDMRYSTLPNQIVPLWGIRLSPVASKEQHVEFYAKPRKERPGFKPLWKMITGDAI